MTTDAFTMAFATYLGCVTGSVLPVHLAVLCAWSLLAGLLVAVGRRGAVLGTQSIIAAVVFGRFSEPALQALGLAGYVLAGGLAQVVFLSVARWPAPLRGQRRLTAAGYRALASIAGASASVSTLPAAAALDAAQEALAAGSLLADAALLTLRSLVTEGQRLRVQLIATHALLARDSVHRNELAEALAHDASGVLDLTSVALGYAAAAIEGDANAAESLARTVESITARVDAMAADARTRVMPATAPAVQLARRCAALAGQLRAIATLAPAAGTGSGLRSRRPQRPTNRPLERLRADVDQIRANLSLSSPAARHAIRLAIVVPLATILARQLPLHRGYWIVVAAATVLRPEFGATFTRGTERALGTTAGVALAGLITALLHPAGGVVTVIVAILAVAGYATFPASWAVGFAFITALVVFLLNAVSPDTFATAGDRLLDTFVGAVMGLAVYALWPTWSGGTARRSLAALVGSQRAYIARTLAVVASGRRADADQMRRLAQGARRARTTAEATVAQSLADPAARRIDAGWSQGVLAALRRLVQAAHVLRLDAQENPGPPRPEVNSLAADLDTLLAAVESRLQPPDSDTAASATSASSAGAEAPPDLRSTLSALEEGATDGQTVLLLEELDEIVDAAHGLASLVGLDPAGTGSHAVVTPT
jgi:uncharacterized membrane protein YccC